MRSLVPIKQIVESRHRNSCTDVMMYDMIDELVVRYFYLGLAVGTVAGGFAILALGYRGHL